MSERTEQDSIKTRTEKEKEKKQRKKKIYERGQKREKRCEWRKSGKKGERERVK